MTNTTLLKISGADIGFESTKPLIKAVEFSADEGEIIGILGVSGIGKSTLLRTIAGLLAPLSGAVQVLGDSPQDVSRGSIGYIPQQLGLVQHQSVGYNVMMGALPHADWWQTLLSLPSFEMRERAREALIAVDLEYLVHQPVSKLSGGQRRRVAVARSCVQRPRLLLADECLGELDAETSNLVSSTVVRLAREYGTTVILVDHNPVRLRTLSDRLFELRSQRLREVRMGSSSTAVQGQPSPPKMQVAEEQNSQSSNKSQANASEAVVRSAAGGST